MGDETVAKDTVLQAWETRRNQRKRICSTYWQKGLLRRRLSCCWRYCSSIDSRETDTDIRR